MSEFKELTGFSPELVEHIAELIAQVIRDDPMFCEELGAQIDAAWNSAELAETLTNRIALLAITQYF